MRVCRLYARVIFFFLRWIVGIRVEVRGAVPTGEVLVAAKHQSFLDILMIFEALPRAKFIMKKELKWAPFIGLYALRIGSTPVARGERGKAMKAMVEHAGRASEPRQLVIYPQGTRVAPGARPPFKVGAGVLYERSGEPCVPAATNAGVFWGRRKLVKRPGLAVVEFLPEIPPGLADPGVHGADGERRRGRLGPADARGGVRAGAAGGEGRGRLFARGAGAGRLTEPG